MSAELDNLTPETIKTCCTKFYENELVAKFLGENFHPGGMKLTLHLGEKLGLNKHSVVLDVACGTGASALALVRRFDCEVTGIDLSEKNLKSARNKTQISGFEQQLKFEKSDAEKIEQPSRKFDAVICECALCTFPDRDAAISEMHRVLKPGGKIGITDITIEGELPESLKNILSYVACVAGALPAAGYQKALEVGGFSDVQFEVHSYTLNEILNKAKMLISGWDLLEKFCNCDSLEILGTAITQNDARELLKSGYEEIEKGSVGYGLFIGEK